MSIHLNIRSWFPSLLWCNLPCVQQDKYSGKNQRGDAFLIREAWIMQHCAGHIMTSLTQSAFQTDVNEPTITNTVICSAPPHPHHAAHVLPWVQLIISQILLSCFTIEQKSHSGLAQLFIFVFFYSVVIQGKTCYLLTCNKLQLLKKIKFLARGF